MEIHEIEIHYFIQLCPSLMSCVVPLTVTLAHGTPLFGAWGAIQPAPDTLLKTRLPLSPASDKDPEKVSLWFSTMRETLLGCKECLPFIA